MTTPALVNTVLFTDWGQASEAYDQIRAYLADRDITQANEAQTRFDVIDRVIREMLGWRHGQIAVEEANEGDRVGFVDYILRVGGTVITIEAKRAGSAFPNPTIRPKLKLTGAVLGTGEIAKAIKQAEEYAADKQSGVVVVTNGLCWCFYSLANRQPDDYAHILFPFLHPAHAERLFELFSAYGVEAGSLEQLTNELPSPESRLIACVRRVDGRIDRNSIADHITPALNNAFYAASLLADSEHLAKCYVQTEARIRFDALLGIHLADPKPESVTPARRIRTGKENGALERVVQSTVPDHAPPVTLIIGPVGAGKSTYLKYFELVSGRSVLEQQKAHWVYIDYEKMGPAGSPREFLYHALRDYLQEENPGNPTDYRRVVEPAYCSEIEAMIRGPWAPISANREEISKRTAEHISEDFSAVEPYVDKIYRFLAQRQLCVVVLDNVDLYEDERLETAVFGEGLALSKRLMCHVLVSIRETTYARHRTNSAFDAYELRKLWLDPPPFKTVLSKRLSYSRKILETRGARLGLGNGMHLHVPDLSVFFDIVQRSILAQETGDFIESVADLNIRKGLTLVTNFLTSGHVQADRAVSRYIEGERIYSFPFHEIFKGTMLGQWRHFKEDRAECINLFDARLGWRGVRMLRLFLLNHLLMRAQREETLEVSVTECVKLFSHCGASEIQVVKCLSDLAQHGLVRSADALPIGAHSVTSISRSGGYYVRFLVGKFIYTEECMFDTAIEDSDVWLNVSGLTENIEAEPSLVRRMELRRERIQIFLDYLVELEAESLGLIDGSEHLRSCDRIRTQVLANVEDAVRRAMRRYAPN